MRFIGNKVNLLAKIYQIFLERNISGNSFFDFFSGTGSVGKFFKEKNYQIYSSDLLYFSYVLQKAYIENNELPKFEKLLRVLDYKSKTLFSDPLLSVVEFLNEITAVEGFIYRNYTSGGTSSLKSPRMYFVDSNGKKIDAIRIQIEEWKNENLLNDNEYHILLACLIESVPFYSNISGVYAAFRKQWDPRALKPFILRPISIIINPYNNHSFLSNSMNLLENINTDILYVDPPYNHRQYAPNYHLLETVARYDDPPIKGIAGLRPYAEQKSAFCNAEKAYGELETIVKSKSYKHLILSYNSEGIMKKNEIFKILKKYGDCDLIEFENLRFKSNSNGESNNVKFVKEQLYILNNTKLMIANELEAFLDRPSKRQVYDQFKTDFHKSNLWLLTEERPKKEVVADIIITFFKTRHLTGFVDTLRIIPILCEGKFTFQYEVIGIRCNKVNNVYIKIVSGYSSFVDYLIFFQDEPPTPKDIPELAIEETKTDDKESRNTGVYQRATKFIYIGKYYPQIKEIMYYNLKVNQKEKPTDTYILGTRLLLTLGVEIIGKKLDPEIFIPFKSIDDIIAFKSRMKSAPKGNVPITIGKNGDRIQISGRLNKNGSLSHDPNIGSLSLLCAVIRKLGWKKDIIITSHGLVQRNLRNTNKFVQLANMLNVKIDGLSLPIAKYNDYYWKYETEGEKLGTIFIHLVVENFSKGSSIFENHAGCEKGYFMTKDGEAIPLEKYKDRNKYKMGDKNEIIFIPDLILIDFGKSEIINVEGKKYIFRQNGIEELNNYDFIETHYISKYYPEFKIIRTVVLYGGKEKKIIEIQVGFLLNDEGGLVLGIQAPKLFTEAIRNLLNFWKKQ